MTMWTRRFCCLVLPALALALIVVAGCKQTTAVQPEPIFPRGSTATPIKDPDIGKPAPALDKNGAIETPAPTPEPEPAKPAGDGIVSSGTGGPTKADVDAASKAGTLHATIQTEKGTMEVDLYGNKAPITVANFVKLARKKFYDGLTFHRVESDPGFSLIQGGDPDGNGSGGPGYSIVLEKGATALKHEKGVIAMARSSDPDSAGCQFYICRVAIPNLDGQYAVFGKVTKGLEVADKIAVGSKITKITIK